MIKKLLLLSVLLYTIQINAQTIMYVNTDTLGIKKFPDKNSETLLYLHAPTKVQVEELTEKRYLDFPEIKENWVSIKFFISDGSWTGGQTVYGYLPKKFLVVNLNDLTASADTTITFSVTIPGTMKRPEIVFKRSSRGLCYYYNSYRIKEIVNSKYCGD